MVISLHRFFIFILMLSLGRCLSAQQTAHSCGSDLLLERFLQNPVQQQRMNVFEDSLFKLANVHSAGREVDYTIPVVVHIIHAGGPENLSDATVIQGINDLNDAFANEAFYEHPSGVNVHIKFCLAKQDETGAFSTGINRIESPLTNMTIETQDQAVKDLIRWDTNKYLNIWLVASIYAQSIGPGVAAYATFPTSAGTASDGIVNEAQFFGTTPDNSKIHTHEVGHYLGLYHTFQNGCANNNCLLDNDRVCDTPPDNSVQAVNCNATFNSCSTDDDDLSLNNPFRPVAQGGTGDQNDLFQDYMDYGFQPCQNRFTAGQSDRMINSLITFRSSLLESNGCNSPCPNPVTARFTVSSDPVDAGVNVNFTNTSTGANAFNWFKNGVLFSTAQNPQLIFSPQGTYYITLTTSNGDSTCYAGFNDTITVTCPVTSSFTASATQISEGNSVEFTKTSTGASEYQWFIGSTPSGTLPILVHTFANPGSYYVTLQSSNGFCSVVSEGKLIVVGTSCNGVSAGPNLTICRGDTVQLFTDTSAIAHHDSLIWEGGTGAFIPNRNVPNPLYIPSEAEQAIGYAELLLKVTIQGTVASPAVNLMSYDHLNQDSVFYISPLDGVITGVQSNNGYDWTAMGYRLADNHLYGISNIAFPPGFYSMDLTTNVVTYITPYSMDFFAGDYDNVHDIFYSVAIQSSTQTLYKVNITDGSLAAVGILGITGGAGGLAANGDGLNGLAYEPQGDQLWGVSYSGKLYSISTATAAATFVGNTQQDLRGLTFDYTTNKLWGVSNNARLYEIDRTSGVVLNTIQPQGAFNYITTLAFAPGEFVLNNSISCIDSLRIIINPLPLVSLGDDTVLCGTVPIVLNPLGGPFTSITWQDGSNTATFSATTSGIYDVEVTDANGCTGADMLEILGAFNGPPLNLGSDTVICQGSIITLAVPHGFIHYKWYDLTEEETNTVYGPGKYWVTVADACGGSQTDTIHINPAPAVNSSLGADTSLCGEQTLLLDAGDGFTSYLWQDGQQTRKIQVSAAGIYYVKVESAIGCAGYDTIQVNFLPGSTVVDLGPDLLKCGFDTVTFNAGLGFVQYIWQDGSTSESFATVTTGQFIVRVKGTNDCWGGDTVRVSVNPNQPDLDLGNDTTSCQSVMLRASDEFVAYLWNSGEITEYLLADSSGTYWIVAQDSFLCVSTDTIQVDIKPEGGAVNIPNVFSPNSDLINDLLEVNALFVADYSLQIFNRWGEELFETTQLSDFWNGANHPEGTYFYILRYTNQCTAGVEEKKGTVTLIR